jgi:hypothetical protein
MGCKLYRSKNQEETAEGETSSGKDKKKTVDRQELKKKIDKQIEYLHNSAKENMVI